MARRNSAGMLWIVEILMTGPLLKVAPYRRLNANSVVFRVALISSSGERLIEVTVPVDLPVDRYAWPPPDGSKEQPTVPEAALLVVVDAAKRAARQFSDSVFEL